MWTLSLEILSEASIDEMSLVATNEIKAVYGEKVRFREPRVKIKLFFNLYRLKFFSVH